MKPSNVSPENAELYELYNRLNHTELYQIARRNGFSVFPDLAREALIRIIIGDVPPPETAPHVIDEWRRAIMRFIIDHRRVLETQINCPAQSFKEDACSACIDTQVLHCLISNGAENYKLIELRKKKTP